MNIQNEMLKCQNMKQLWNVNSFFFLLTIEPLYWFKNVFIGCLCWPGITIWTRLFVWSLFGSESLFWFFTFGCLCWPGSLFWVILYSELFIGFLCCHSSLYWAFADLYSDLNTVHRYKGCLDRPKVGLNPTLTTALASTHSRALTTVYTSVWPCLSLPTSYHKV